MIHTLVWLNVNLQTVKQIQILLVGFKSTLVGVAIYVASKVGDALYTVVPIVRLIFASNVPCPSLSYANPMAVGAYLG